MNDRLPSAAVKAQRLARRGGRFVTEPRMVPEETAVALTYNGSTHAVMMATPADLEDFAVGFSLTEGFASTIEDIEDIGIVATGGGIDLQVRMRREVGEAIASRRRAMAGPAGCGLCGVESIEAALRPARPVRSGVHFASTDIVSAIAELSKRQPLNGQTGAAHAAGFHLPGAGIVLVREDVGRHNALDKLIGAMARSGIAASTGVIALTCRISVEMVQKAAAFGVPVIAAVSAPTALAVRTADAAGVTLAALVRGEEFELCTHFGRIDGGKAAHVA
ncbi:MAG: formate dehydrogenase accessory sulfurtransferase FdhD [Phyllobacteriaceae bacterium]|nr:formate dehydrogenase accessory sulfurtransferase FdhD [Phyllobacteriaceae bacterium]